MRPAVIGAFGALLAVVAHAGLVRADDAADLKAMCAEAYERAQEQRLESSLIEARELFGACVADSCPEFIREDCSRFVAEVNSEVPSASFVVESRGLHLADVRVSEGQRVLAERLDETPLELNPGSHWLRFEAPGTQAVTQSLVIARGEKARVVRVELAPLVSAPPPTREVAPTREDTVNPLPWALLGIGAAGMTSFALFAASGRSEEARLERSCAPNCSASELQSVETKYLVADVSLVVGVSGILVGGYWLLTQDSKAAAKTAAFPVVVRVGASGGSAMVRGDF